MLMSTNVRFVVTVISEMRIMKTESVSWNRIIFAITVVSLMKWRTVQAIPPS